MTDANQRISPACWRIDAGAPLNVMRCGIGACWHAIEHPSEEQFAGSAWGGNPPAEDEAAWQRLYELADWTRMSFLRVAVSQRMYEPKRRSFTWDSPEMRILVRILDWCQSRGAVVFLQQQYNNVEWNAFPEFRGDEIATLRSGPHSLEEFTYGIVSLVDFLVRQRGYDCIRYLGLNNEPDACFCWESPQGPLSILPAVEAVSGELAARALPVTLAGPDLVEAAWSADTEALALHLGAFEVHTYGGAFDWRTEHAFDWCYPMAEGVAKFAAWAKFAHGRGAPFFLGEIGTFDYGMGGSLAAPSSYEAALKDVEYAIRLVNAGVDGFCRWSFVNRGNIDGQWQLVDTWDAQSNCLREIITPHPNSFFLWGLLSRFISAEATILSGQLVGGSDGQHQHVFACAARALDGSYTLAVVNDGATEADLHVRWDNADSDKPTLHRYRIDPICRDRTDIHVDPQGELAGDFEDALPPMSLTVYSTRHRRHDDKSPVIEGWRQ